MPIYVYERPDGTRFEHLHKQGEEELKTCPTTGVDVKKIPATAGIILEGAGFYTTDYKKKGR